MKTVTKTDERIASLAAAFRAAKEAASTQAQTEDGGTCNFDTAVIRPGRGLRNSVIEAAAAEAGVSIGIRDWMGRAVFVYVSHGQGNRNTRMAEAAEKALRAAGLDTTVYYQMD